MMIPVPKKLHITLRNGNLYYQERQSKINANSAERVERLRQIWKISQGREHLNWDIENWDSREQNEKF